MSARVELLGRRFGRLVVLQEGAPGDSSCVVRCDCGVEKKVDRGELLATKGTKSCGCLLVETRRSANLRHGHTARDEQGVRTISPEHTAWTGMKTRCFNENTEKYPQYGGRGITVCERWMTFENFFADMGPRPSSKHSLDRRKVDENYEPGNCRWATVKEQSRNKQDTCFATWRGETLSLADWAERTGIPYVTLHRRLRRKIPEDIAFTAPASDRLTRPRRRTTVGEVFGRWTILSEAPRGLQGNRMLNIRCECGVESIASESSITSGLTRSCRPCGSKIRAA